MKRAKKLLSLLLVTILVTALCSCGGGSSSTTTEEPAAEAAKAAEETVASEAAQETDAAEEAPQETADTPQETADMPQAETAAEPAETEAEIPDLPTPVDDIADKYTVADLPTEGTYNLFAVRNEGYTVDSNELGATSSIVLDEGGTGTMESNGETIDITSWSAENGMITLTLSDDSSASGAIRGGVIELDIYGTGDMLLIYAQEGADTSGYELLTMDEVKEQMAAAEAEPKNKLGAVVKDIDPVAGAHLHYQLRLDALNAVQEYDVQSKEGKYYSSRTTKVGDFESTMITCIVDGKAYNLYPETMTGTFIMDVPLSITDKDLLLMDSLYSEMRMAAPRTDFTEEEREVEGTAYPAEVFPQTDSAPETVFYFADDGTLAYCFKATPLVEVAEYIGESFYTIEIIDTAIDESLFDISAYTLEQ